MEIRDWRLEIGESLVSNLFEFQGKVKAGYGLDNAPVFQEGELVTGLHLAVYLRYEFFLAEMWP